MWIYAHDPWSTSWLNACTCFLAGGLCQLRYPGGWDIEYHIIMVRTCDFNMSVGPLGLVYIYIYLDLPQWRKNKTVGTLAANQPQECANPCKSAIWIKRNISCVFKMNHVLRAETNRYPLNTLQCTGNYENLWKLKTCHMLIYVDEFLYLHRYTCDYPFATWELARRHQGGSPIALLFWTGSGTAAHVLSDVFKALVACALSHEKAQVVQHVSHAGCPQFGISIAQKIAYEYLMTFYLEGRMSHSALAMEWEADGQIRDKARKLQLVSRPIY